MTPLRIRLLQVLLPAAVMAAGALSFLALPVPGAAQSLSALSGGDEPLYIDAEQGIEWQRDQQLYLARGNAVARRGEVSVSADMLIAHYRDKAGGGTEIHRIDAKGNVVITSPNERAYGDHGVYTVDRGVMQLTGDNLRLETENEVVTARDSLEYWQDYNGHPIAVARGAAVAERPADKQRISADILTATLEPDENGKTAITRVDAFGNVELATAEEYARGERGVYYVAEQRALLDGNVKITRGKNQLNGQRAVVDMKTGVSRLIAGDEGRVHGLLSTEDAKTLKEPE